MAVYVCILGFDGKCVGLCVCVSVHLFVCVLFAH